MTRKALLISTMIAAFAATSGALILKAPHAAASPATIWPAVKSPAGKDAAIEAKIDNWIARMSVEQKIGQMIQAEIKHISPDDAAKYHIGSILNGGGSWPTEKADGPLGAWLNVANLFYGASVDEGDGRFAIPIMWGTDAVHGHNNVVGATIFPHNIGLGAGNNPGLMRDIGTATAREIAVTGIDWTFAPTVAVAKDARWGRTYESYSSDAKIVANLGKEYLIGLQGHPALENFLSDEKIIGTAKHFIGDGGTEAGDDQADTVLSEAELLKEHGQGYIQALAVGVQTVMASFSSWNGEKLHGHKYLLTDVLKNRMGFDGLVVGDWNGHEQLEGCTVTSCAAAYNAGIDLIMVPTEWKPFLDNTISQAKSGEIPMARIDDAVRRILRVKYRAGLFNEMKPSQRALAGRAKLIGHPDHRAVARAAVRESLVMLKNDGVLPIDPNKKIFITGSGADNPAFQSGGWTVTWQGRDIVDRSINPRHYYKGHTSIEQSMSADIKDAGGRVLKSADQADVAIVVFGEAPYAEFEGDLGSLDFDLNGDADFKLLQQLKADNIPVVTIFLSGRPRGVDAAIDASDAFVAAWLPGSEGTGVSDVLLADDEGRARYDFKGRLPFAWPQDDKPLPVGDADQAKAQMNIRYKRGYGLTYSGAP